MLFSRSNAVLHDVSARLGGIDYCQLLLVDLLLQASYAISANVGQIVALCCEMGRRGMKIIAPFIIYSALNLSRTLTVLHSIIRPVAGHRKVVYQSVI